MAISDLGGGLARMVACVLLAGGGLVLALGAGPQAGPVAAVFPPWWDAIRAVEAAAAGGAVLRLGVAQFIVLISPDGDAGRTRLRQAGAWLLLDPRGLAGCRTAPGVDPNAL